MLKILQSGDFSLTTLSDSSLSSFSRTGSGTLRAGCGREQRIETNLIHSLPAELDRGSGKWHLCHFCHPLQDSRTGRIKEREHATSQSHLRSPTVVYTWTQALIAKQNRGRMKTEGALNSGVLVEGGEGDRETAKTLVFQPPMNS